MKNISDGNVESFGDFPHCLHRNRLFTAFHLADVNRMKIRLFRQLFLAEPCGFAKDANVIAQSPTDLFDSRHARVRQQEARNVTIA